ncbi:MAG TPA: methyltransferase domain-containing protein [Opitutaceae bacterium]|nr:methyltransferase domain-containing protein [Opitutaceae bacterium]
MKTSYHEEFYEINAPVSAASANALLRALREIYPAATLLDVGCGIGTWGQAAKALGFTQYKGVDGDYVSRGQLLVGSDEFLAHDLCRPFNLGERFDLAICMEVGEHLPAEAAGILVHSLCVHAPVVLFSAAIPRQGGVDHVNEQWQSYWAGLFAGEGYEVYDCIRPRVWERGEVAEYYKQNALVYVDRREEALSALFGGDWKARKPILNLVHPATYQIKSNPLRWPLPTVLRSLPAILFRVIKNRLLPS